MLSQLLDWAVVAIPILAGVIVLFFPAVQRRGVIVAACLLFSALIWAQQHTARVERAREMANLPTKEDIAKLPTAGDIVKEFAKVSPEAVSQTSWGLTDEQLLALSRRISPLAPAGPPNGDLITAVMGDPNSIKFAQRLAGAFRAARWKGVGGSGFGQAVFGGSVEGIVLQLHSKEDTPLGLKEFVQSLREAGIEPTGEIAPGKVPKGEFRIIVGSKPSR